MWAMTEDANFADGEIERFYNETFIAKRQKTVFRLVLLYSRTYYLETLILS